MLATPLRPFVCCLGLLLLFLANSMAAAPDVCFVCGREITDRVYTMTDEVTDDKRTVCGECARLPRVCYLCGLPVKSDFTSLPDGRFICARDGKTAVLEPEEVEKVVAEVKESLDRTFSRFLEFPNTNVTMNVVDRVDLQELFKFAGNDYSCPNVLGYIQPVTNHGVVRYDMSLLTGLPHAQLKAVIAHEYTHSWVFANVPPARRRTLGHDAHEGFCELIAYLLMQSQGETDEIKSILRNHYTRGQIQLFIEAERRFGLNEIVDWMKSGVDSQLSKQDLNRVRMIDVPKPIATPVLKYYAAAPGPTALKLKGIVWAQGKPLAMINDQTFAIQEQHPVHVGQTKRMIRCLSIEKDSAKVRLLDSGREEELILDQ